MSMRMGEDDATRLEHDPLSPYQLPTCRHSVLSASSRPLYSTQQYSVYPEADHVFDSQQFMSSLPNRTRKEAFRPHAPAV